jgi:hypothetical protein
MSAKLIDRLKQILGAAPLPPEARARLGGVSSLREGVGQLDELITANEVEFRELQSELENLERLLEEEERKAGAGGAGKRTARVARLRVEQLERHADALEERLKIHDANLRVQIALLGKLQTLDAMELRGLDERQVDSITLDFEEELERYRTVLDAAGLDAEEAAELEAREERREPPAPEEDARGERREPSPPEEVDARAPARPAVREKAGRGEPQPEAEE